VQHDPEPWAGHPGFGAVTRYGAHGGTRDSPLDGAHSSPTFDPIEIGPNDPPNL